MYLSAFFFCFFFLFSSSPCAVPVIHYHYNLIPDNDDRAEEYAALKQSNQTSDANDDTSERYHTAAQNQS